MKSYPANPAMKWKESDLQKAVVSFLLDLERLGILTFNHSPNEGKRAGYTGNNLKAQGLRPGHPDLDIYLRGGKTILIELKTMTGKFSKAQEFRTALLSSLGFRVYAVMADTPQGAVKQIEKILRENGIAI